MVLKGCDLGVSFSPVRLLGGKIDKAGYEARRDRTTTVALNDLLASPEYREWVKTSAHTPATKWQELGVVLLALLVVVLLFASPLKVSAGLASLASTFALLVVTDRDTYSLLLKLIDPINPMKGLPSQVTTAPASGQESNSLLAEEGQTSQQTALFQEEALRLAHEEASTVAQRLHQKEEQLLEQLDKNAYLELSLWTAEHAVSSITSKSSENWTNASTATAELSSLAR